MQKRTRILICGMICFLIMGFCYTYSVIQPYVMDYFSIDSGTASLPYTIFIAFYVVGSYIGGMLQRKVPVKKVLFAGYTLMVVSHLLTAFLPSGHYQLMWLTFGAVYGIGDGMVYNVIIAMLQMWFQDKKGLATGLTLSMLGVSTTVLSPFCSALLKTGGFRFTFLVLAAVFVAFAVFGTLTISAPPAGYTVTAPRAGAGLQGKQYEIAEVIHSPTYYKLLVIQMCSIPAFMLISAVFVTYGEQKGLANDVLVAGVSIASVCQVAGRFLIGILSDRIGTKRSMLIVFAVNIAAVVLLMAASGYVYVITFCMLSFTYGGSAATMPSLTTDYFGTKNAGGIVSLVLIGMGISSIGSSVLAKLLEMETSFLVAGVATVIGMALVLLLPRQSGKK